MLTGEKVKKKYNKAGDCPIAATVDVIGGKWKPIIIWILMHEPKRFGELSKSIPGISLKVLARHLKELETDSIIIRKAYPEVPPKVEYSLSEKGRSLSGVMQLLALWSRDNILEQP
jgi:DNA-binding HxlR family transcriptional regulator